MINKNLLAHVIICGAGISGLTTASELVRAGYTNITILEAQDFIGGKAASWNNNITTGFSGKTKILQNMFSEHSTRVWTKSYISFFNIMKWIPSGSGSVFDNLVPMKGIYFRRIDGTGGVHLSMTAKDTITDVLIQFKKLMKIFNVPSSDISFYFKKLFAFGKASVIERYEMTKNQTFAEYMEYDKISKELILFLNNYIGTIVAARPNSSAKNIMELLGGISAPATLEEYENMAIFNQLNGPTKERLFDPWLAHLKSKGVKFKFNTFVNKINKGCNVSDPSCDHIYSVNVNNSETPISGDIFIIAVPQNVIQTLLPSVIPKNILHREISFGIQCYMEQKYDFLEYNNWYINTYNSPWEIVRAIYSTDGENIWKQSPGENLLPDGIKYVMSITMSAQFSPGLLYGKSFIMCTPEETAKEMLYQAGVPLSKLDEFALKTYIPNEMKYIDVSDINKYPGWQPSPLQPNGKLWINNSSLYVKIPSDPFYGPKGACNTDILTADQQQACNGIDIVYSDKFSPMPSNGFLTGEFINVWFPVATMELTCEAGKTTAQAIIDQYGSNKSSYKVPGLNFDEIETKRLSLHDKLDLFNFVVKTEYNWVIWLIGIILAVLVIAALLTLWYFKSRNININP